MRKKKSGASLALLLLTLFPTASEGAKKKVAAPAYALVSGTVFQEKGYALPSAEITLVSDPQPDSSTVKVKKMQAVSNARGEFVFRVPPASMRYTVKVSAKGYQGQEKPATVQGEVRIELTFQLQPESK